MRNAKQLHYECFHIFSCESKSNMKGKAECVFNSCLFFSKLASFMFEIMR